MADIDIAPGNNVTRIVEELKADLTKEYGKGENELDVERCLDILKQLEDQPMTLKVLSETLVGTIVSKFKSIEGGSSPDLEAFAKGLVKKWKKLAKSAQQLASPSPKPADKLKLAAIAAAAPTKRPQPSLQKSRPSVSSKVNVASGSKITKPSNVISIAMPEEWTNLTTLRQNICKKMLEILSISAKINGEEKYTRAEIIKVATDVEAAIEAFSRGNRPEYSSKARQLSFNLKKNADLRLAVLQRTMEAKKLTQLTPDELCSQELARERAAEAQRLVESRRLDWEQANENKINEMCGITGDLLNASLFTCGRCKSTKTTSTQKQTRSADEPMTVFVFCTNCGKRWKC
jgi:transcription elongation factor S-II